MKTLCLSLGVAALACLLACSSAASGEEKRAVPIMPLVPSKEERLKLEAEAQAEAQAKGGAPAPAPALRTVRPRPSGGLRLRDVRAKTQAQGGLGAAAEHHGVMPNFKPPKHTTEREPQPDIAGTVSVAHDVDDGNLRIINGKKAKLGQFPWQAGILMRLISEGSKIWCGGSIIHSMWILTAGHCIDDSPDDYTIIVGSLGSEKGSEPSRQEVVTTETYQHPMYNNYYIDNDIGIIKLPTHLQFNAYVRPVQLPSYSMAVDMMTGTTGNVAGWGKTKDTDSWITSDLMYTSLKIDKGKACYDYYGNSWIPNKICIDTSDGFAFCSGDSGGPFTIEETPGKHTQIGIVSFGAAKGCEYKLPIAFTRLPSFLQFVEDVTNIAIRQ